MEQKKVVLKIESFSVKDGLLLLSSPYHSVTSMIQGLVSLCNDKYSGFVKLTMQPPYKPRSLSENAKWMDTVFLVRQIILSRLMNDS